MVDAAVGLVVVLGGLLVALLVSAVVGVVVAAAGVAYLVGGLLRWRRWARLRAAAGLDRRRDDADP